MDTFLHDLNVFPTTADQYKINPIAAMHNFLAELLKYDSLIIIVNTVTKAQLIVANNPLPSNKEEFKKFFLILTDT